MKVIACQGLVHTKVFSQTAFGFVGVLVFSRSLRSPNPHSNTSMSVSSSEWKTEIKDLYAFVPRENNAGVFN